MSNKSTTKGLSRPPKTEIGPPEKKQDRPFVNEIAGLLLLAAGIFVAASLLSFSPNDPSLNHYSIAHSSNWMGPVGANLSDFLLEILGYGGWWVPIFLLAAGCSLIFRRPGPQRSLAMLFAGWTAVVFSTCMLLSLLPFANAASISGGIAGTMLSGFFMKWTGPWGAALIGFVSLLTGLMLATSFTFSGLVRHVARIWPLPRARQPERGASTVSITSLPRGKLKVSKTKAAAPKVEGGASQLPKITEPIKPKKADGETEGPSENSGFQITPPRGKFTLPSLAFLKDPPMETVSTDKEVYIENARALEQKLLDFGVAGNVVEICPGPVVTMYEFSPAPGVKINKVAALADDLALALKTHSVRIVAPIPGKAVIGIELANAHRQVVYLKEILASEIFQKNRGELLLALGKDIVGQPVVTDLAKMPHLLIAGATGTGKSVGLNAMICSLLYRLHPDKLRILMIDPKRIELSLYDGIPHLIHPVVSEPKEATRALRWAVAEMERRYQILEEAQARNLVGYNKTAEEPLPYLIVIIDELADLMMVSSKEVESAIARLAQMARAAGIHLLIATQRPSVDVLTGLIKANFPARLSFKVSSKVDSRTILDVMGAERLLGMGDMLFLPPGSAALERIHGAYVSEDEINQIVGFLKSQGEPDYDMSVVEPVPGEEENGGQGNSDDYVDAKYDEAIEVVTQTGQASISGLQRRLRIGYNRAARMIEQMEKDGIVTPTDNMGRRQVIARKYE